MALFISLMTGILIVQGMGIHLCLLCISLAFLIYAINNPQEAFMLYLISYPLFATFAFSFGKRIPDLSYSRFFVFMLLFVLLFRANTSNLKLKKFSKYEILMSLFCISAIISMFMNYDVDQFIQNTLTFMDNFIIPFLFFFSG